LSEESSEGFWDEPGTSYQCGPPVRQRSRIVTDLLGHAKPHGQVRAAARGFLDRLYYANIAQTFFSGRP
jgi:hypothetical protein